MEGGKSATKTQMDGWMDGNSQQSLSGVHFLSTALLISVPPTTISTTGQRYTNREEQKQVWIGGDSQNKWGG